MNKFSSKIKSDLVPKLKTVHLTLLGFFQIGICLLVGQWLSELIPFPSSIIGLFVCCSVCLYLKRVPQSLDLASNLLLKNMPLFFIPYVVTITVYWPELKTYWFVFLIALFISTLLTLAITSILCDKLVHQITKVTTRKC